MTGLETNGCSLRRIVTLTGETLEKRPLLSNLGVRLKFQSAEYSMYACG